VGPRRAHRLGRAKLRIVGQARLPGGPTPDASVGGPVEGAP
jgi:hypothetical protein